MGLICIARQALFCIARQALSPSPPLGVERVGVRRGIHGARVETHLTLTLSPLKGGEGKYSYVQRTPA
jgi:hypothetical protein